MIKLNYKINFFLKINKKIKKKCQKFRKIEINNFIKNERKKIRNFIKQIKFIKN